MNIPLYFYLARACGLFAHIAVSRAVYACSPEARARHIAASKNWFDREQVFIDKAFKKEGKRHAEA